MDLAETAERTVIKITKPLTNLNTNRKIPRADFLRMKEVDYIPSLIFPTSKAWTIRFLYSFNL